MEINHKLLKKVDDFSSLYDERLTCFVKIADYKCYDKDEIILKENDTKNQSLFLIANGQVKVFISGIDGTEATLEILNRGEFFGEMSLIDGEPCSASVKAIQKSDLFAISREAFLNQLQKNSKFSISLLMEISRRKSELYKKLAKIELMSVYGKIISTIMDIIKDKGTQTFLKKNGTDVKITYNCPSQQQIADLSGTTIEAVSRAISYLERNGFIAFSSKDLYVFKNPVLKI
jgi:CRP/FNR family transcriptional regulator/CRP/FNR family cyclic AMP-dependent transcriptional regulator